MKILILPAVACSISLGALADDLIARDGVSTSYKDVIVYAVERESISYWHLGTDGRLEQANASPKGSYRIVYAPEKLEAIRDRWRRAGLTIHVEYKSGLEKDYHNCFFDWTAPPGYFGSSDYDSQNLPLKRGAVPLRSIDSVEVADGGDYRDPVLKVTTRGRGVLGPDRLVLRSKGDGAGRVLSLVPAFVCFGYQDKAPFVFRQEEAIGPMRKASITRSSPPSGAPKNGEKSSPQ